MNDSLGGCDRRIPPFGVLVSVGVLLVAGACWASPRFAQELPGSSADAGLTVHEDHDSRSGTEATALDLGQLGSRVPVAEGVRVDPVERPFRLPGRVETRFGSRSLTTLTEFEPGVPRVGIAQVGLQPELTEPPAPETATEEPRTQPEPSGAIPIPEPASLVLIVSGLLGLAARQWLLRRRPS